MRTLATVALLSLVSGVASAAPCHHVVGTWQFQLACVSAYDSPPLFGTSTPTGTITHQDGCAFAGTVGPYKWVGVLHGDNNRLFDSDYGGAKLAGELTTRRAGEFTRMDVRYTYSTTPAIPGSPTACVGTATRD
ncbi:MAG: hypothetical protein ABI585_06070 [Betaproteobacteria bacterium]